MGLGGSRLGGKVVGLAVFLDLWVATIAAGAANDSGDARRLVSNGWLSLRSAPFGNEGGDGVSAGLLETPRSVAADDLDEDGIPDLVVGMGATDGGLITIHRGNPDAVYPFSDGARRRRGRGTFSEAPFLPDPSRFALPEVADFVGTGDFDNDGHRDVLAARWGSDGLYFLSGDGAGSVGDPVRLELPGRLTAAVVGEVNRRDGLADLVVALENDEGAQLLVFEGPEGVRRAEPEAIPLPGAASALALGRLDGDLVLDVAVAVGDRVVIVHGRDRKLSLSRAQRDRVPAPVVSRLALPFVVADLATGDFLFDETHRDEIALLGRDGRVRVVPRSLLETARPGAEEVVEVEDLHLIGSASMVAVPPRGGRLVAAHTSILVADDLWVVDGVSRELRLVSAGPEPLSVARGLAEPDKPLERSDAIVSLAGVPVAVLPLRLSPDPLADLVVLTAESPDPRVLFADMPLGGGNHEVNQTGQQLDANPGDALCDIDLALPGLQCTLVAALQEAELATTEAVSIGFKAAGSYPWFGVGQPIRVPLTIDASGAGGVGSVEMRAAGGTGQLSLHGGSSALRGLVISGSSVGFQMAGNNVVESNWIGTDLSGTLPSPFGAPRFSTQNAPTRFGGTAAAARNVVSGNSIQSVSSGDVIQGNFIGTDKTGTVAIGNGFIPAVAVGAPSVAVGGTASGAGNLISGNLGFGASLQSSDVLFQGNLVGTTASGLAPLGNGGIGIVAGAPMLTIGGTAAGAGNVVSNNGFRVGQFGPGIRVSGSDSLVQGNRIGTDSAGLTAMGNNVGGVRVQLGGSVGGQVASARNVIADSRITGEFGSGFGVELSGSLASQIEVAGNAIGVGSDGTTPLGNEGDGVSIHSAARDNTIGGADPGSANAIAYNEGAGVLLYGGAGGAGPGNEIVANRIYSNGTLGIDLGDNGPTPNDPGDADGGPNDTQNFPVIAAATSGNLQGSFNSRPNRSYRLEAFSNAACDPSGFGEGQTFLGSIQVTTDGGGNATFDSPFGGVQNPTLTATDLTTADTSEFSSCFPLAPPPPTPVVINSVGDAPDLTAGDGICDTGGEIIRDGVPEPECTLRAAIQTGNEPGGVDNLRYDIPPGEYLPDPVPIIRPSSLLPAITAPLVVDGGTQPGTGFVEVAGAAATPVAEGGPACGAGALGSLFTLASPVPGARITKHNLYCALRPVFLTSAGRGAVVHDNLIGTDFLHSPGLGGDAGVEVSFSAEHEITGNTIVSHQVGVLINAFSSDTVVSGNFIGTDAAGALNLGNRSAGISVQATGVTMEDNVVTRNGSPPPAPPGGGILVTGGDTHVIRNNTITLNDGAGLHLQGSDANVVEGNLIGADAAGVPLGNQSGVVLEGATGNTLRANVVASSAGSGVFVAGTGTGDVGGGNRLTGNFIGTDSLGRPGLGNGASGVFVSDSRSNTIGGGEPSDRNVISNNGFGVPEGLPGIRIIGRNSKSNVIQGNFIGTTVDGGASMPNAGPGIRFEEAAANQVGGPTSPLRNVVSANGGHGIHIRGNGVADGDPPGTIVGQTVDGNHIGTSAAGTTDIGNNGDGVFLERSKANTIGLAGNVISGNKQAGVRILGDPADTVDSFNRVQANVVTGNGTVGPAFPERGGVVLLDTHANTIALNQVGASASPPFVLGNTGPGVRLVGSKRNTIRGNDVNGNSGFGVEIRDASHDNAVHANRIGVDASGVALGNGSAGIQLANSRSNTIGALQLADRNVVSNNGFTATPVAPGIQVSGNNAKDNVIRGNYVGTDFGGAAGMGNASHGIAFDRAAANTVGGPQVGSRNVISANGGHGIYIFGNGIADGDPVGETAVGQAAGANYIGTNAAGTADLGNTGDGVFIEQSEGNTIGGAFALGNLISGNQQAGVRILAGPQHRANVVSDNLIGTDATGNADLGNEVDGVKLLCDFATVEANTIWFNGGRGVYVLSGARNLIFGNSITSNAMLGIDLRGGNEDPFFVTANDPGDGDAGPNDLLNFPVIEQAIPVPGPAVTVRGTLDTDVAAPILEFFSNLACDASGHGEGRTPLAIRPIPPGPPGPRTFAFTILTQPGEPIITATSSGAAGPGGHANLSTSEFSSCRPVPPPPSSQLLINEVDATTAAGLELVELSSAGDAGAPLNGKVVVFYDGATDTSYAAFDLDGFVTDPDGYFVLGNAGVPGVGLVFPDELLQDGPDAVALYDGNAAGFPDGTPVTTVNLIDAVVYGGGPPDPGLLVLLNPSQPQLDEASAGNALDHSLQRCPDGSGGPRFTDTSRAAPPTPGDVNHCAICYLTPPLAQNVEGTDHTVTALVLMDQAAPAPDVDVSFDVASGPNAGTSGSAATGTTGEASFTYEGAGGLGDDTITASGAANGLSFFCSATKSWVADPLTLAKGELAHGSRLHADLASSGGAPDPDLYRFHQEPYASYEIVLDAASGDVGAGAGPALDLLAPDGSTILQSSLPAGAGPSRSLRFRNTSAAALDDRLVRVASQGCTSDCGPDDVYRLRAWETTYGVPRFNNTGTQVTVLLLQNATSAPVSLTVYFWAPTGALLASHSPAAPIPPQGTFVLNTAAVPGAAAASGTLTLVHDAPHGALAGKAVALEPSSGFSFDSPMEPRAR